MFDPTQHGPIASNLLAFLAIVAILLFTWQVAIRIIYRRWRRLVRHHAVRFRDLVENIEDVFYETDPSGEEVLYVSPAYENIWGLTRESLYENPMGRFDVIHPEDRERVRAAWHSWVTRDQFSEEYRIIRPDGSVRWIWDRVVPIRDKSGRIVRIMGFAEDISKHKQIEAALEASKEKFRNLAENLGDIVYRADPNTLATTYVNRAVETIYGYSAEEWITDPLLWESSIHPDDRGRVFAKMEEARDNKSDGCLTYRIVRADKSERLVENSFKWEKDREDKVVSLNGIVYDVTERKAWEEALRKANDTLEQRVVERSRAAEQRAQELTRANAELDILTKELRSANVRLEKLSLVDPLTELLNRRGLQQMLSREVHWAMREGSLLFAILLDLDDFKDMNDTLGYPVGDVVLREAAKKLKATVRATDHIGRIGGDEFMVLMPHTRPAEGMRVAEKIRLGISGEPVLISTGQATGVTASLGLVMVPHGNASLDDLVSQAHLALYRSKQAGKNQVFYGHIGTGTGRRTSSILVKVLTSLRGGDSFHVVAQPIVELETLKIVGYELLSRSTIETFEMPDDFFRVSLDANMLTAVDFQCFKKCMGAAGSFLPAGVWRHLNLFPSTLINMATRDLLEVFPAHNRGGTYCIEISEQQIIGEPSYLARPISALRRAGFLIAIDDVGFGRSSLESLVLLEPDIIKIDRKCVRGVTESASGARSLKRILEAASTLGSEVVAEGIESEDELIQLRRLNVKFGQGFFLGRPAPLEELEWRSTAVKGR